MQIRAYAGVFSLIVGLSSAAVLADSKIEYKATEGGGTSLTTLLIGQGRIRSDTALTSSVIIDPTANESIMLDHGKKTFTKIGREDLQQMIKMLADLDKAMADMPPEARQMMAARMGGAGSGEKPVTADTGEKATVAGKSCRIFRTTLSGKTTAEYCMADASAIDLPAADRATMAASMAWSKELSDALAKSPIANQLADTGPFKEGMVPLRSTTIAADGTRKTSEFVGVSTASLPADMFKTPADYKEAKLPMNGRGRGRGRGGN